MAGSIGMIRSKKKSETWNWKTLWFSQLVLSSLLRLCFILVKLSMNKKEQYKYVTEWIDNRRREIEKIRAEYISENCHESLIMYMDFKLRGLESLSRIHKKRGVCIDIKKYLWVLTKSKISDTLSELLDDALDCSGAIDETKIAHHYVVGVLFI